ncbi:MAG: hypothetical protein LBF19_00050 [Prevotellaceae bacterium]|jgi:hypothetical protein|nr:hypothetical protein [Prevotellaceae bacterium]
MGKSYMPYSDAAFHSWQGVLIPGVVANATAWNIPATEITDLQTLQTRWKTAYADTGKLVYECLTKLVLLMCMS